MTTFEYRAYTGDGSIVRGCVRSESVDEALASLRTRALFVTSLRSARTAAGRVGGLMRRARMRRGDRQAHFRSLATLVGAGVGICAALNAVADETKDEGLRETLASLRAEVERGSSFAAAAERHPEEFSSVTLALLRAGERRGAMDEALAEAAALDERRRAIRRRLTTTLTYPAIVTVAAVGLLGYVVGSTLPAFASLFAQLRVPLPITTRVLLRIALLLHDPRALGVTLLGGLGMVLVVLAAARRTAVRAAFDDVLRRAPVIGPIVTMAAIARFARTFGTLLRGGVALPDALTGAIDTAGNAHVRRALQAAVAAIARGDSVSQAFGACRIFTPSFMQLTRAGEASGALDIMMLRLCTYYEDDLDAALSVVSSSLEPLLICLLGGAIATVVGSVIVPLYSMIGSLR